MGDTDLADIRKQCMDSLYLCTDNVLQYLDSERDSELASLKNCVREYCLMEARQVFEAQAMARAAGDTDASSLNSLEAKYNAELNKLETQSRLNIDNHPFMKKFDQIIRSAQLTNSQNLDESDIAITETQEANVDPITKRRIEDPVRNTLCGHIYERSAILNHIRSRRAARCPVAGCGNRAPVDASQLVEDELARLRLSARRSAGCDRSVMDLDDSQ